MDLYTYILQYLIIKSDIYINCTMPKDFGSFFSRIQAEKCHFLGEFSRISGSYRSLAICTTVVQLGILRLRVVHPKLVEI